MLRSLAAAIWIGLAAPAAASCIDLPNVGGSDGPVRVELPEMRYLATVAMVSSRSGFWSITAYPPLPRGGIDGQHLCGMVSEHPFAGGVALSAASPAPGVIARRMSLQLHQGIDYARTYRRFYDDIAASGQLRIAPRQVYTAWRLPGAASSAQIESAVAQMIAQAGGCAGTAIVAASTVLVPDC